MKSFYLLFASVLIAFTGIAQDTVKGQVIRVDTVKIQNVRVDTVYVPSQPPAQQQVQQQQSQGSQQKSQNKNDKVYYGGYANFSLGKYTFIGFEPFIGYKLLPKLSVGGKISYEFYKNKNYTPTKEGSNYGAAVFSRLRIARRIYAHVEFSEMNYKLYNAIGDSKNREWISFLYIGGGYSLPISKNASLNAQVLWDVLQNDNSPHKTAEPLFSVGVAVGF